VGPRPAEAQVTRTSDRRTVRHLAENGASRTPELDEVRRLLFPELPPDEGWARIDAAMRRAERERRIDEALIDAIRRLKEEGKA